MKYYQYFLQIHGIETNVSIFLSLREKAIPMLEMQYMRWWVYSESQRRRNQWLLPVEGVQHHPRRMKQKRVRSDMHSVSLLCTAAYLKFSKMCVCVYKGSGEEWWLFLVSTTLRLDSTRCRRELVHLVSWWLSPQCHLCNCFNLTASLCYFASYFIWSIFEVYNEKFQIFSSVIRISVIYYVLFLICHYLLLIFLLLPYHLPLTFLK